MNQIITIKEIKGFSRVRAKVGWGGVGVTLAETWLSGEPSGEALEGCHKPSGGTAGRPPLARPGRFPGPPAARWARVFVSLIFSGASPTPSAVPSLTSNNLLASPGLCFPGGHRHPDARQPPGALVGPASDTPSGPRPLPARRQGSKAARVTWSPSSTESAGRAEGESGWKPRNPAPIAAPGPAPAPAPGRSPHARRPPGPPEPISGGHPRSITGSNPAPTAAIRGGRRRGGRGEGETGRGPWARGLAPLCPTGLRGAGQRAPTSSLRGDPHLPAAGPRGGGGGLRAAPAQCRGPGLGAGHRAGGGGGQRAGG